MSNLPSWVKPNAIGSAKLRRIALHRSGTLFTIQGVKKARNKDSYFLNPWANGGGVTFPLSECRLATPDAVPDRAKYITPNGHQLTVERIPIGFAVSDGKRWFGVSLVQENGLAAAQSLAQAFSGKIVEVDDDNW
jgi:hypothetical protein